MKFTTSLAALALVATVASPAFAAPPPPLGSPVLPSCGAGDLTGTGFSVLGCVGFLSGNLVSGNPAAQPFVISSLDTLGLTSTGEFFEKLESLSGTTIDFITPLSGLVYLGIHRGGASNGSQGTAFYELSVTSNPVFTFNLGGLSNAAVYGIDGRVPGASVVPEPETYALMLAGLGVLGFMGARRKNV